MENNEKLEINLSKLDAFGMLEPDWDSEDGLPFTQNHINYIKELLPQLPKQPKIFPTGRGSIQLEYERRNGNYLEFEIFENRIEVLQIIGYESIEWTVDEFDVDIINKFYNEITMKHVPTINLIAAVAADGSIGGENKLLWKIPKDLEFYKAKTLDNVIIMGLETYKTLPKVALKDRHTVVVCRVCEHPRSLVNPENVHFAFSIQDALRVAKDLAKFYGRDIFIAGGASIYEQMMQYCDYAFITWVNKTFEEKADKFFPVSKFLTTFEIISESIWHGKFARAYPEYKFSTYKTKK